MKKLIGVLFLFVLSTSLFFSCTEDDPTTEENNFDQTLLYGKWVSGTLYYTYSSDKTGTTWDVSDDVTEDEAQSFTWTLVESDLTHIYIMEVGGNVPKYYTVTKLSSTSLVYEDSYGTSYSFSKVES